MLLIFSIALIAMASPALAQGTQTGSLRFTLLTNPPGNPSSFTMRLSNASVGVTLPDFSLSHNQTTTLGPIPAIAYTVTITVPPGWRFEKLFCDLGETNTTDPRVPINVKPGEVTDCVYTVQPIPGDLSVSVFHDLNADGVRQGGDSGLQGWAITATGGLNNVSLSGTTNANGLISFNNLLPGTYTVCETLQSGWLNSAPGTTCTTLQLLSAQVNAVTFGNYRPGSITIAKETTPDADPQLFTFGGDLAINPLRDGQSQTFTQIRPGSYDIFETAIPANWALDIVACVGGSITAEAITNGVAIPLRSGEAITCTFNNLFTPPPAGSITIRKETTPDGAAQTFNFTGDLGNFPLSDGQAFTAANLPLRDYTVRETLPAGWTFDRVECAGGLTSALTSEAGVTISLRDGDAVTCTFFNVQAQTGSVIASKYHDLNANGADDAEPPLSGWTMTLSQNGQVIAAGATNLNGRIRFNDIAPGTYTLCETLLPGWQNSDPGDGTLCKPVAVTAGDVARVAFGNFRPGQIIVRKVTVPDTVTTLFEFTTSYGDAFALGNGMFYQSAPLRPSTYSVTETPPGRGWQIDAVCDNGNAPSSIILTSGSQVTCVFTNTDTLAEATLDLLATPTQLVAPGGEVTYAVMIANSSRAYSLNLTSLTDNTGADLNGRGTCAMPQTLAVGGTYQCQYTGQVSGAAGAIITTTVTANGSASNNASITTSDSVEVRIIEAPCTGNLRRDLTGVLYDPVNNTITGVVTNASQQRCDYLIGLASYKKFDEVIDNQELFAYVNPTVTLAPGESYTLTVNLPQCATQVDLFYGRYLPSLNGVRYGSRLLKWIHLGHKNYCTTEVLPITGPLPPSIPPIGAESGGGLRK